MNQDYVSEWINMSICGILLLWAGTKIIQLHLLVKFKTCIFIISSKCNLFLVMIYKHTTYILWYSWITTTHYLYHCYLYYSKTRFPLSPWSVSPRDEIFCRVFVDWCSTLGRGWHISPLWCTDFWLVNEICQTRVKRCARETEIRWVLQRMLDGQM